MFELKFLGTAGARFAVAKQIRYSGGVVLKTEKQTVIIDPGPGSLVRLARSKPRIDIDSVDGVLLTHIHLDHSSDVNVILDSITQGGIRRKGFLITTKEAIYSENRVILPFVIQNLDFFDTFEHGKTFKVADFEITAYKHLHPVETYGLKITSQGVTLSLIVDTEFFPELCEYYAKSDVCIINVVRYQGKDKIMHLSVQDAERLISEIKPAKAIITHFGLTMLRNNPREIAQAISRRTGVNVVAAEDGMSTRLI